MKKKMIITALFVLLGLVISSCTPVILEEYTGRWKVTQRKISGVDYSLPITTPPAYAVTSMVYEITRNSYTIYKNGAVAQKSADDIYTNGNKFYKLFRRCVVYNGN